MIRSYLLVNLVSWDYPSGNALKDWVDRSGMHPITCMQSLRKKDKQVLLKAGIVMCRDLGENATADNRARGRSRGPTG